MVDVEANGRVSRAATRRSSQIVVMMPALDLSQRNRLGLELSEGPVDQAGAHDSPAILLAVLW